MDDSGLNSGVPLVPPTGGSGEAWISRHLSPWDPDGFKAFLSSQFSSAAGKSSDQPVPTREDRLNRLERILSTFRVGLIRLWAEWGLLNHLFF